MGRTQRRRTRKKARKFSTCGHSEEIVLLNSWLSKQGMRCNEKLVLAVFDDTGRGVLTKKKIRSGEELMTLPLNSTINVTNILTDLSFCSIFVENSRNCIVDFKQSVSFQSLLAFYLVFLKVQGSTSKWFVYLESLPKNYTVPYFLPNEIVEYLDNDIVAVISKQKNTIQNSYNIFEEILKNTKSNFTAVERLQGLFSISLYEWAYFTVNTRCVYMDLSKLLNLNNLEKSILNVINDNTKISLCPYLDMINHSPNARNETKLMVGKNIQNISVNNVDEALFSDVSFSIYTKNNFDPFTEVFICYGDSHNLKLITEYGFYLPSNDLDFVSFDYEQIIDYLQSKLIKLSQDQTLFINNHGLNRDLYIDVRGLSFNLYGLLLVVKYFYSNNVNVGRLLYSAAVCSKDKNINELITPMIQSKLENIKDSISKLAMYENECILNNCIALMSQYVKVLEKFMCI